MNASIPVRRFSNLFRVVRQLIYENYSIEFGNINALCICHQQQPTSDINSLGNMFHATSLPEKAYGLIKSALLISGFWYCRWCFGILGVMYLNGGALFSSVWRVSSDLRRYSISCSLSPWIDELNYRSWNRSTHTLTTQQQIHANSSSIHCQKSHEDDTHHGASTATTAEFQFILLSFLPL